MDPFSAIGFASNILSFIDFGWKVITEAREIYNSASGTTSGNQTLETTTQDVKGLCAAITAHSVASADDLQQIAQECKRVADELLAVLRKSTLPKHASKRLAKCRSLLIAARKQFDKGELDAISNRLQHLQIQLVTRMQSENSAIATSIRKIESCNMRMGLEGNSQLKQLRAEIIKRLEGLEKNAAMQDMGVSEGSNQAGAISDSNLKVISTVTKELSARISTLERSGHKTKKLSLLLQSLHFDAIRSRRDRIDEAHVETYQWVLKPGLSNQGTLTKFVAWLRGDQNTFWIRGKPGSGKSVLMKYLSQHPSVREHLTASFAENRIVIAQYFFWNSGTALEKSQEGLLRSLLFEILQSFPELPDTIEIARRNYGTHLSITEGWSRQELLRALELVSQTNSSAKICFFIDGLDEYKGDTSELLSLVHKLASITNMKLCVSSRPWTQFKDFFGGEVDLIIKLEDLTRSDIRCYVDDSLQSNKRFVALAKDQTAYNDLTDEVVFKAQGVFLWVKLVVHSLIQGATYADSLADMRKRVDELPADLETFFEAILADVDPRCLPQTAFMAQVILAVFYFIDDLLLDPDFALEVESKPLSEKDSQSISDQMAARLDGRFKGLIEVPASVSGHLATSEAYFIHRTAEDFLRTKFVAKEDPSSVSNVCSVLCHAAFATLKCTMDEKMWEQALEVFVKSATEIEEAKCESLKLDQAVRQVEIEQAKRRKRYNLFFKSLSYSWYWYVKERFTTVSSRRELAMMVKATWCAIEWCYGISRPAMLHWFVDYVHQKANANKVVIDALRQAFAFTSRPFKCRLEDEVLIKLLAAGLPLSTSAGDGWGFKELTVRDIVAKRATPDNPNCLVFLRFLENRSEDINSTSSHLTLAQRSLLSRRFQVELCATKPLTLRQLLMDLDPCAVEDL
ncbi:hypothetical protein GGR55DRAFT_678339 [Xylaria sp. FL0064]|nr:hypothetical protein GGR55DRAFT_678339 [Xylaria sp. FL0064]